MFRLKMPIKITIMHRYDMSQIENTKRLNQCVVQLVTDTTQLQA